MSIKGSNIILIGMPGSGKSTFGRGLAKYAGLDFIDTDDLIEQQQGIKIQTLLDRYGAANFRCLEDNVLAKLQFNETVISTGGSSIYGERGMLNLQQQGRIVHLHISLYTLMQRVTNSASRGLVKPPKQSLSSLYRERMPYYQRWANLVLVNDRALSAWQMDRLCKQILDQ